VAIAVAYGGIPAPPPLAKTLRSAISQIGYKLFSKESHFDALIERYPFQRYGLSPKNPPLGISDENAIAVPQAESYLASKQGPLVNVAASAQGDGSAFSLSAA
jgi:hypothetical protein